MSEEKTEEEKKVEVVEDIKYENYCDAFVVSYKKGAFVLMCGQAVYKPSKMLVRIWMDPSAMKALIDLLNKQFEEYQRKFGE